MVLGMGRRNRGQVPRVFSKLLRDNKLIIFTEYKETAQYLFENLNNNYPEQVLLFTGDSSEARTGKKANRDRQKILQFISYRLNILPSTPSAHPKEVHHAKKRQIYPASQTHCISRDIPHCPLKK